MYEFWMGLVERKEGMFWEMNFGNLFYKKLFKYFKYEWWMVERFYVCIFIIYFVYNWFWFYRIDILRVRLKVGKYVVGFWIY